MGGIFPRGVFELKRMTLLVLFVILAIGVSFLCSILEAVLLSITPSYVEAMAQDKAPMADKLRKLREDIERPLAAILSLNTIAHTVGATGAGAQAGIVFDDLGVGIFSAVLTLGILVLSEIIPKTLGATYWRGLVPFTVRTRLLKSGDGNSEVSREEIAALASAGQREGVVEEDETRVVKNLFRLPQIKAHQVMTPRTVIESVSGDATVASIVEGRESFTHSRLPVIGESVDEISGFVLTRDLLQAVVNKKGKSKASDFVRELPIVAEDVDLDALLDLLLERDAHIALVQDEIGGTAGLVTMEDVIETLLGSEIVDEHDKAADLRQVAKERAKQRKKS